MRFLRPLSGIGHRNLPAEARLLCISNIISGRSNCFNSIWPSGPSGSWSAALTVCWGLKVKKSGIGVSSSHRPAGLTSTKRFSRQHPAQRMTNDMGIVDLQLIKEVEVIKGKVNDVVEVFDPLARAKPGMG